MKRPEELGDALSPSRVAARHWRGDPEERRDDVARARDPVCVARSTERAWVEIHLGRLRRNVARVKSLLAPTTELMAVVKADAYGHGALLASTAALASGASSLGVATVEEGLALREAGFDAPILILGYVADPELIRLVHEAEIGLTICSSDHARRVAYTLRELAGAGRIEFSTLPWPVHLKVDTGMGRLGEDWERAETFFRQVRDLGEWLRVDSLYSHLACADAPDPAGMIEQRRRFECVRAAAARAGLEPRRVHLANTAATLRGREYHYDMVRIGLAIYGMVPAPHLRDVLRLDPALAVKARITQLHEVRPGESVSYGSTYVADRPLRTATVGIGYADGVSLRLSGRMSALVRGARVRQIGRITMDQVIFDVTHLRAVRPGDVVTLIGTDGDEEVSVVDWAEDLGTIPWEVLCLFHRRLPRIAVDD